MALGYKYDLGDVFYCDINSAEWIIMKAEMKQSPVTYGLKEINYTVRLVKPVDGNNYWEQEVSEDFINGNFKFIRNAKPLSLSGVNGAGLLKQALDREQAYTGGDWSYQAPPTPSCWHPNKYINKVFTTAFWVCPDCKKDLGNA
jgi:hypothetical protein